MKLFNSQTGDTIVEVLIAIAIVGLVLVGAYVTSNRSLLTVRSTQEHSEALGYAQGELENLQSLSGVSSSPIFAVGIPGTFCVSNLPGGGSCSVTNGVTYTIKDSRAPGAGANQYVFTVNVSWPSLLAGSADQVSLSYKIDQ